MEEYAEELRTPPIALVALIGCQELHKTISAHLHSDQPPINTLALPDFISFSTILPPKKEKTDAFSGPVPGIIKKDWVLKHRARIPSVVAALFSYSQISGDPTQWLQVCTDLETLKFVTRGRNMKMVLIIVQETPMENGVDYHLEDDDGYKTHSCIAQHGDDKETATPAVLVPGEDFKKVFSVNPNLNTSTLQMGTLFLKWGRKFSHLQSSSSRSANEVVTKHKLPDMKVELPPLVVTLECPPHAILGTPFTYFVKVLNTTQLLQEIKFTSADSQSFVMSGSHNDTVFILPKSEHVLSYMLVPLTSGLHQLPRVLITSTRYSAGFQPSLAASAVFIYPSLPRFMINDEAAPELVPAH